MVPKTYSLREERLMAMSEHFHLSFTKKFLGQAFVLETSLGLVLFLSPGSQNPLELSHSAPENDVMLQGIFIERPALGRPVLPFGWVGSHQQQPPPTLSPWSPLHSLLQPGRLTRPEHKESKFPNISHSQVKLEHKY